MTNTHIKLKTLKRIIRPLPLIIAALCIIGCTQPYTPDDLSKKMSALDIAEVKVGKPSDLLKPQDVRDDINLLVYALEHGYSGKLRIPPALFNKAIHALKQLPQRQEPLTRQAFITEIKNILKQLPDAHLGIASLRQIIEREQSRTQNNKKNHPGSSGQTQPTKPAFWSSENIKIDNKSVLYIKISDFVNRADPRWEDLYTLIKQSLPQSSALIVDIRNNPGGDSHPGSSIVSLLTGPRNGNSLSVTKTIYSTPESASLFCSDSSAATFSQYNCKKVLNAASKGDERHQAQQLLCQNNEACHIEKTAEHEWRYDQSEHPSKPFFYDPSQGFNGMVYLLINKDCDSSCEMFVLETKANYPYTITAGQATGGFLHFGAVSALVLPKTHAYVAIPTVVFNYYPSYQDKRGIPPDVYVAEDSDALATTKNMIMHFKHW